MDKHERLRAIVSGEQPDRPGVALWRHFPVDDQKPENLAAATLDFQAQYDWDFVKVSPSSSFCLKDWGADDAWRGNPEGSREYTRRPVQQPGDWTKLAPLDPEAGFLGAQLQALRMIGEGLKGRTPYIQTVFSPLSQARNLAGADRLLVHLRRNPAEVKAGLAAITETAVRFVRACEAAGADGLFYAMQWASYQNLSEAEYREFGEPFDRQILAAAQGMWLNVLHLHGEEVMFHIASNYPAQVLNWHDRETSPDLAAGQARFSGAVCGGLRQWDTLAYGSPEQVQAEAESALEATGGQRFILGTGCVSPVIVPRANLMAAREVVGF